MKIKVLEELEDYYFTMAKRGVFQFIEIDTLEQAGRHMDFFHKELKETTLYGYVGEFDTDCWRHSVDLPLIESMQKDVLIEKDFTLIIGEMK